MEFILDTIEQAKVDYADYPFIGPYPIQAGQKWIHIIDEPMRRQYILLL